MPINAKLPNTIKASFWKRLIAFVIDSMLVMISVNFVFRIFPSAALFGDYFVYFLFYAYGTVLDYYLAGTLGKKIMKLKVVGEHHARPTIMNCFYRNIGKTVTGLTFGAGFIRILAPHRSQTIHDEIGHCFVIDVARK